LIPLIAHTRMKELRVKQIRWLLVVIPLIVPESSRGDEPRPQDPADLAAYDALVRPRDREYWAFQPVKRPTVPSSHSPAGAPQKTGDWARNPVDAFIFAKLEAR